MAEIAGTPTASAPHKAESNVTVHEAHDGTLLRDTAHLARRPGVGAMVGALSGSRSTHGAYALAHRNGKCANWPCGTAHYRDLTVT